VRVAMIMNKHKMIKLACPVGIPDRPAINVIGPLESLFYDFSRTSLQITPFSQIIAYIRAGNAGVCVKLQPPGDISKTTRVLECRKHEGYCKLLVYCDYIGVHLDRIFQSACKSCLHVTKTGSDRVIWREKLSLLKGSFLSPRTSPTMLKMII